MESASIYQYPNATTRRRTRVGAGYEFWCHGWCFEQDQKCLTYSRSYNLLSHGNSILSIPPTTFNAITANFFFAAFKTKPRPAALTGTLSKITKLARLATRWIDHFLPWPSCCGASTIGVLYQSSFLARDNMMLIYSTQHIQNPVCQSGSLGLAR